MNKLLLILSLGFINIYCSAQNITKKQLEKERLNLKNYAFCQCLKHVYENQQDSLFEVDGSISAYVDIGAHYLYVYERIDSIAKVFSQKIYKSKDNKHKLGMMKCLDFYNSQTLDSLVIQLDHEINIGILNEK
jgi:hypothetical protein